MTTPATYGTALAAGWRVHHTAWTRGYVSRKSVVADLPATLTSERSPYRGMLTVDVPNWTSTRYATRVYLVAPDGSRP